MTTPPAPSGLVVARSPQIVTGPAPVAAPARLSTTRVLIGQARAHPVWTGFAVGLLALIGYLELWDDGEVRKAIQDWDEAANFLGGEQFGQSLEALLPSAEDWTFDDREAFDKSIMQLTQEIGAIVKALEANSKALAEASEKYRDAIDGLVDALLPILLAVIYSVFLTKLPHTAALGVAIGAAGATATAFIITEVWNNLSALFTAVAAFIHGSSVASFVADSRPGWSDPNKPDPNIRDIVINYNLDPSAYKK